MAKRIPTDAFDHYVSLGAERSYAAVATHFGVSRQALTRYAVQHKWAERLATIEREARARSDQRLVETIEELNSRHLRVLRVIEAKSLDALRALPLDSAMDAVRALDIVMRQTRLIHGEPTDRTSIEIEDKMKEEARRWMRVERFEIEPDGTERRIEPASNEDAEDLDDDGEEAA